MASKRAQRRRAARDCERKRTYSTRVEAEQMMDRNETKHGLDPEVAAYQCAACHKWHLGHHALGTHKTSHDERNRTSLAKRRSHY